MDATRLQAKVYKGYGLASKRIGYVFTQYRPQTPDNAIFKWSKLSTLNAAFSLQSQSGFKFDRPNEYKSILWSGLFDASATQVGDYLVHPTQGTYFIAAQQHLLPILCVQCSTKFDVLRTTPDVTAGGQLAYSGITHDQEITVINQFPGAIQWQGNARHDMTLIESDMMRRLGWIIFLPQIPGGAVIKERDILIDVIGRRYQAFGVYITDLGYRIQAELLQP